MKNILKTILILIFINITITLYMPYSYGLQAQGSDGAGESTGESTEGTSGIGSYSSILEKAKNFIDKGQEGNKIPQSTVEKDLKPIAQILMGYGVLTLLCVGAILGLTYMFSGTDEKSKIKEKLIWYVVAAVIIFGAVSIFNIVISILNNLYD